MQMTTVSTETAEKAYRTANALKAAGIPVDGVEFTDDNSFLVLLADAGGVQPTGVGGGTGKSIKPEDVDE